jgi:hypothetical protein
VSAVIEDDAPSASARTMPSNVVSNDSLRKAAVICLRVSCAKGSITLMLTCFFAIQNTIERQWWSGQSNNAIDESE